MFVELKVYISFRKIALFFFNSAQLFGTLQVKY